MKKQSTISAKALVALLAVRHGSDVFVPECKTGPTHDAAMQRMDAWAMTKSWKHPRVVAYEVKVSRGDLLRDNKWRGYLPYCNELWFCCPPGICEISEIPEGVGLIVCSTNATRLYTKKKAVYRNVQIPEDVLRYVLFSRSAILSREALYEDEDVDAAAFWRDWLADKRDLNNLGRHVGRALRQRLSEEIDKRDCRQQRLEHELEKLEKIRRSLIVLGFAEGAVPSEWEVRKRATLQVPPDTLLALERAERACRLLRKRLAECPIEPRIEEET